MVDQDYRGGVQKPSRTTIASGFCLLLFAGVLAMCAAPAARPQSAGVKTAKDVAREVPKADAKKAKASYEEGLRAEQRLDWEAASAAYSDAAKWDPNTKEYPLRLAIAKSRIVQQKVDAAERDAVSGRLDAARRELLDASSIDPSNKTVQERIVELMAAEPERVEQIDEPEITGEPVLAYRRGQAEFRLSRRHAGGVSAVGLAIRCEGGIRRRPSCANRALSRNRRGLSPPPRACLAI